MIKYLENETDYKEIIKDGTWLIDFYADWCGPCKMLSKELESINKIEIIKVNVDDYSDIEREYGVMSMPTLILFNEGKEIKKSIGLISKEEINTFIEE